MVIGTPQHTRPDIKVGAQVTLPGGEKGLVRFIGRVEGKPGEYAGVEMLPGYEDHGKHSGEFEGVQYFTTAKPHTGLFVSFTKLIGANVTTSRRTGRSSMLIPRGSPAAAADSPTKRFGPSTLDTPKRVGLMESPRRPTARGLSMIGTPARRVSGLQPSAVLSPPGSRTTSNGNRPVSTVSSNSGMPASSPRKARVSAMYGRTASSSTSGGGSGSDSQSLRDQIQILTAELNDARNLLKESESKLADQDIKLADQDTMIRDMEVSLNEVQEIVLTNQRDPDIDIEGMRQAVLDKDNKINAIKTEFELKRQEFRVNIETLEAAMVQRNEEYEDTIRSLEVNGVSSHTDNSTKVLELERQIGELEQQNAVLTADLKASQISEKNSRVQLSRLADVENRLLDKEQEVRDLSESVKSFKKMLEDQQQQLPADDDESHAKLEKLTEALNYEKSRGNSLEQKFGEEVETLTKEIESLKQGNISLEQSLDDEKNNRKKLEKEHQRLEGILEIKIFKETEMEKQLEGLKLRSTSSSTAASATSPAPQTPTGELLKSPAVVSIDELNTPLPVYKSSTKIDPTAGREMWCGLCERSGHESLDCPYEEEF